MDQKFFLIKLPRYWQPWKFLVKFKKNFVPTSSDIGSSLPADCRKFVVLNELKKISKCVNYTNNEILGQKTHGY